MVFNFGVPIIKTKWWVKMRWPKNKKVNPEVLLKASALDTWLLLLMNVKKQAECPRSWGHCTLSWFFMVKCYTQGICPPVLWAELTWRLGRILFFRKGCGWKWKSMRLVPSVWGWAYMELPTSELTPKFIWACHTTDF